MYDMRGILLVTRPDYDYATRYLSTWAKKIVDFAEQKGKTVLDLEKKKANRKTFESMLIKQRPSLVFLNGHGNETCVTGHDNEPLVVSDDNENLLEGKIVYALACSSMSILGPNCTAKGAFAYIGYQQPFILSYTLEKRTRPEVDQLADLFLGPSNLIMTSLLKDHSVDEAIGKGRSEFSRNISDLVTSVSTNEQRSAIPYLLWDMQNLSYSGDGSARPFS